MLNFELGKGRLGNADSLLARMACGLRPANT